MKWESNNTLIHWGIKGQQWGIRRFQNEDGSLTPAGKTRYQRGRDYDREYHQIEKKRSRESS